MKLITKNHGKIEENLQDIRGLRQKLPRLSHKYSKELLPRPQQKKDRRYAIRSFKKRKFFWDLYKIDLAISLWKPCSILPR